MSVAGLPLFERYRVPPAAPGSETSEAAAVRVTPTWQTKQARVLAWLKTRGEYGATRQEMSDALGIKLQSICSTVAALVERTQVVATARRRESREVLVAKEAEQHGGRTGTG